MARLTECPGAAALRAGNVKPVVAFSGDVLGLALREAVGPTAAAYLTAGDGMPVAIDERLGMPAPENTTLGFPVSVEAFDGGVADLRGRGSSVRATICRRSGWRPPRGCSRRTAPRRRG